MKRRHRYIFGPVPSRRLGLSLGVDIIPYKTCTLDCIYCQLGRTTRKTVFRRMYAPPEEVITELRSVLRAGVKPDWITFSGSGEPTLHTKLGKMIRAVKRVSRIPVAVLTNGTLLWKPEIRKALAAADLVIPDLDAGSAGVFRRVNRPHPSLSFRRIAAGIEEFTRRFPGRVWLEVVLVRGINDGEEELRRIARLAARIRPERVQLNTVLRPPADRRARPLTEAALQRARSVMQPYLPGIPVEIVARFRGKAGRAPSADAKGAVLKYLKRRPATLSDLSASLGIGRGAVKGVLKRLIASGLASEERVAGKLFFIVRGGP